MRRLLSQTPAISIEFKPSILWREVKILPALSAKMPPCVCAAHHPLGAYVRAIAFIAHDTSIFDVLRKIRHIPIEISLLSLQKSFDIQNKTNNQQQDNRNNEQGCSKNPKKVNHRSYYLTSSSCLIS